MSVQKRKRERDKAERAAMKREERSQREPRADESSEPAVATDAALEGYGLAPEPAEDEAENG